MTLSGTEHATLSTTDRVTLSGTDRACDLIKERPSTLKNFEHDHLRGQTVLKAPQVRLESVLQLYARGRERPSIVRTRSRVHMLRAEPSENR